MNPNSDGRFVIPSSYEQAVERFLAALGEVNQFINLISFTNREELRGHVEDSLWVLNSPGFPPLMLENLPLRVLDVGTGGGFPGVPVALARPSWRVTLLDSLQKKQRALGDILEKAGISNAQTLCARAEDLARDPGHREIYDIVLCRAVGRFSTVAELTVPFLKVGGVGLLHRGQEGPAEAAACQAVLSRLGARLGPCVTYQLPGNQFPRHIVCVEKRGPTPEQFPRRSGIPTKRPLGSG